MAYIVSSGPPTTQTRRTSQSKPGFYSPARRAIRRLCPAQNARTRNGQPRPGRFPDGAVSECFDGVARPSRLQTNSAEGSCKPNSVVCGHSSRRRVAADAHQRPTRRFRHLLEPPVAYRADTLRGLVLAACASLPIWSCSVWGLPCPLSYDSSGALLPHLFTLTPAREKQASLGMSRPFLAEAAESSRGGIFSVALAVHEP